MSNQTLPETNPANRPVEMAPSAVASEEPSFARTVGMTGVGLVAAGIGLIAMNRFFDRGVLGVGWAYFAIAVGLVFTMYLAVRDNNIEIRRTVVVVGYFLLALMVAVSVYQQSYFLAYGWACGLIGLCYLLCFSKHETEPEWRKPMLFMLGGVGAAMAVIGFVGGMISDHFLPTYGSLLAILGLIYLCAFISQSDRLSDTGYHAGLAMGGLGALALLYAVFRAVMPALLKTNAAPFLVPNGLLLMFHGSLYLAVSLAIVSDNTLVVQIRRELTSYFFSPVAYIVMLGMALLGWVDYYLFINSLIMSRGEIYEPIILLFLKDFPVFATIFVVPAITMRLMSEEKRTGTYEVLMCAPIKESTVVFAKFFSALTFFMLLWGIWALYLIALRVEGDKAFEYRPLLSFFLAVLVSGSGFIGMGLFISSLTTNQIIAATLTFMGMIVIMVMGFLQNTDIVGPIWKVVFKHLSYPELWDNALRGHLQVREMILQGSFAFFWLFLTVKVLEARRWS